jgi:NAD(P)-dependent dehydrogenase (short-subunit alcohol dehydrogenase family)
MAAVVVVITGASSGLGCAIARAIGRNGFGSNAADHVHLVLASRSLDALQRLEHELQQQQQQRLMSISVVQYDATLLSQSNERLLDRIRSIINGTYQVGSDPLVVCFACAGSHEPAIVRDACQQYRYSTMADFTEQVVQQSLLLNATSAAQLLQDLRAHMALPHSSWDRLAFIYISSQAADPKWWPLGNALYGAHKYKAEQALSTLAQRYQDEDDTASLRSRIIVRCLRYPLIDTPMAVTLYNELIQVEAAMHQDNDLSKPPLAQSCLFHNVDTVAQRTTNITEHWISAQQQSESCSMYGFDKLSSHVWNYTASIEHVE